MTYREAMKAAEARLCGRGVPAPDTDARLLLEYAASLTRSSLFALEEEEIPETVLTRYRGLIFKREKRIPLQLITGSVSFMGIELLVNDQVLIPRQDTEILAETAIRQIRKKQRSLSSERYGQVSSGFPENGSVQGLPGRRVRVLDLCTGSGCLIISAAKFCPGIEAVGTDVSAGAVGTAVKNAQKTDADVTFLQGDLFEKVSGRFDVILSNPPYIRTGEIGNLMEEVRDHEPRLALDGGEDGLFFYRKIADQARGFLSEDGFLLLEIGADQGREVSLILRKNGYQDIRVVKDLAGLDRVVCGRWECLKT